MKSYYIIFKDMHLRSPYTILKLKLLVQNSTIAFECSRTLFTGGENSFKSLVAIPTFSKKIACYPECSKLGICCFLMTRDCLFFFIKASD